MLTTGVRTGKATRAPAAKALKYLDRVEKRLQFGPNFNFDAPSA
jgi:hypothetical protein